MVQSARHEAFCNRVVAFERRLQANMKNVFVPVHLCIGQEHVGADIYENLKHGLDWVFSHHRNHAHYFAAGGSEQKLWDEIMGLESGVNQGFSGSQGISDKSINFHASAIVGGLVGVATGTAYALKMDRSKAIVVSVVGDAGTEAGVYWESLNFAALHQLPIAYIVENNGFSVDSPIAERQATPLIPRAAAFGIRISGTIQGAMELARRGVPSFCEMKVTLKNPHINMASLEPKDVIA